MVDRVDSAARAAEEEIDKVFQTNPLVREPFAVAATYLLSAAEDQLLSLEAAGKLEDHHAFAAYTDNLKFYLKNALLWLRNSCPANGSPALRFNPVLLDNAISLLGLAADYNPFVLAFTYGTEGIVAVTTAGNAIEVSDELRNGFAYEAYDRMTHKLGERRILEARGQETELPELIEAIDQRIVRRDTGFNINLGPQLIKHATDYLRHVLGVSFTLPSDWRFKRYSLGEFFEVFLALAAISTVHHLARVRLARALGNLPKMLPIRIVSSDELVNRVVRYSKVNKKTTSDIIDDLTYGSRGQAKPDPALQPLVPLNRGLVALTPVLFMTSNAERNLIALMNRFPEEREVYARLTERKEALMRDAMLDQLHGVRGWRTWFGQVPGQRVLPDVDLALVSDQEKACIVTELKWLLDPAEVGEILHRNHEIGRGVQQVLELKAAFEAGYAPLLEALAIDSSYQTTFGVVSANTIGMAEVQSPHVFVTQQDHLVARLQSTVSLVDSIHWLSEKRYLPVEGKDFEILFDDHHQGSKVIKWHKVRLLVDEPPM